jgi:hypothetical protein
MIDAHFNPTAVAAAAHKCWDPQCDGVATEFDTCVKDVRRQVDLFDFSDAEDIRPVEPVQPTAQENHVADLAQGQATNSVATFGLRDMDTEDVSTMARDSDNQSVFTCTTNQTMSSQISQQIDDALSAHKAKQSKAIKNLETNLQAMSNKFDSFCVVVQQLQSHLASALRQNAPPWEWKRPKVSTNDATESMSHRPAIVSRLVVKPTSIACCRPTDGNRRSPRKNGLPTKLFLSTRPRSTI